MELTPNDIRNTTFESSFRGYEKGQVDSFVESVAAALEQARTEIARKVEDYDRLKRQNDELKEMEDTVKHAVLEAQKHSDQIVAHAKKEAELMISEAKQKRDAIIEERHRKVSEVQAKVDELVFMRNSFYNKLRGEIEAHLKLVNSISPALQNQAPAQPDPKTAAQKQADASEYHAQEVKPDEPDEESAGEEDPNAVQLGMKDERKQLGQPEPPKEKPKPAERPQLVLEDSEIDRLVEGFQEEVEKHTEEVTNGQSPRQDI